MVDNLAQTQGSPTGSARADPGDEHLERMRRAELETVVSWIAPGARVLELGGGSGYQAQLLAERGCHVLSFDVAGRPPPYKQYYPVLDYDGTSIPAPDAAFDIVFSSNVLEHVEQLAPLLDEMRRVLAPNGLAIHLVPSSTWRLWTCASLFPWLLKVALGRHRPVAGITESISMRESLQKATRGGKLKKALALPLRPHGAYTNALSELYYFTRRRWRRVFARAGFQIIEARGTTIFHTGFALAPSVSPAARRALARRLGSACHLFVLRPAADLPHGQTERSP